MAHSFSFGSSTQPKQSTPMFSFGNAQTTHQKSNEPITKFSFGSGVHQTQPATTPLTTQQQIERLNLHEQNQEEIARTNEFINKARGGFSFGNGQPSHQKVPGFSFGSAAANHSSNRQASCLLSTRQEKTEEEVVQLRKEVKLLRKKLKEMAIVEERVKQLEYLQYNKDVKVLLLGDSGVGKSTLVHKHLWGQFRRHHLATTEIDITSLQFHHNKGAISFQLWEFPGKFLTRMLCVQVRTVQSFCLMSPGVRLIIMQLTFTSQP